MHNMNNIEQLTKNRQPRLGGHKEQQRLFSLVHIILC